MKHRLFRNSRLHRPAFTLIELLVVIGIIAILAAVTLQVSSSVINAAKRAKAANTASQIQTAVLGYYTEYSVYPVASGATTDLAAIIKDDTSQKTLWGALIECLSGNVKPSTGASFTPTAPANTRSIAFLSMKASDVDANDAPLNPLPTVSGATTNYLYFNIAMDADYDGILGSSSASGSPVTTMPNFSAVPFGTTAQAGGGTSTAGVAVWANCNAKSTSTNANFWVHTY